MVLLKHLSREFDINPPKLRAYLRESGQFFTKGHRWTWDESKPEHCKELIEVRAFLKQVKEQRDAKKRPKPPLPFVPKRAT